MIRYFVYDAEYDRDAAGHATYQAAERFDPDGIERLRDKDPRIEPRWVFKRPVAISWLVLKEEDGKLSPEQFRSIGSPEMSEAELLGAFFSALNELPSNVPVVTWGGSSSDEPQIRLAALRLPSRQKAYVSLCLCPQYERKFASWPHASRPALCRHLQPVEAHMDMRGHLGTQLAIIHAFVEMRQHGLPCPSGLDQLQRQPKVCVRGVRFTAQAIHNQQIAAIQQTYHFWRYFAEISCVSDAFAIAVEPERR